MQTTMLEDAIKVVTHGIIRYNGGEIEIRAKDFVWNYKSYGTLEEVKDAIDKTYFAWQRSIRQVKNKKIYNR